jgi:protein involved in ribonucleotide reduction
MRIGDTEVTGITAARSAVTYLAAAKGLAVVEIAPPGEMNWLTKFQNKLYRLVVAYGTGDLQAMTAQAVRSVENSILRVLENRNNGNAGAGVARSGETSSGDSGRRETSDISRTPGEGTGIAEQTESAAG